MALKQDKSKNYLIIINNNVILQIATRYFIASEIPPKPNPPKSPKQRIHKRFPNIKIFFLPAKSITYPQINEETVKQIPTIIVNILPN